MSIIIKLCRLILMIKVRTSLRPFIRDNTFFRLTQKLTHLVYTNSGWKDKFDADLNGYGSIIIIF